MFPSLSTALSALAIGGLLWSCASTDPSPEPAAPSAQLAAGDAEPVELDDGLSYKERRKRNALRGFDYGGERLRVVEAEATQLVRGYRAADARRELTRGQELLERNLRLEAISAFTRAALLSPEDGDAYAALGDALLRRRWSRRAELAYRAGVEVAPTSSVLRFKLADSLARQGKLDASVVELKESVALDPNHAEAQARLAVQLYYAHDYDAAWRAVQDAEAAGGRVPPQLKPLLARHADEPRGSREGGR